MSENVLLKNVLDGFIEKMKNDADIPAEIIGKIEELRVQGKIAKGTHLKSLIENFIPINESENAN